MEATFEAGENLADLWKLEKPILAIISRCLWSVLSIMSYHAVDIDFMLLNDQQLYYSICEEMKPYFASGLFKPPFQPRFTHKKDCPTHLFSRFWRTYRQKFSSTFPTKIYLHHLSKDKMIIYFVLKRFI